MIKPLVIYDTEAATWEDALETGWGGENQHPEIVQIGAIKVDEQFDSIAQFEVLIKPAITQQVSSFFTELTGITQEQIDTRGLSFREGYGRFLAFCDGAYVICNGWDREAILENIQLYQLQATLPLIDSLNIRPWIASQNIPSEYRTSGKLATYFGLSNGIGRSIHDGLYDSESIRLALRHLYAGGKNVRSFVEGESVDGKPRDCVPLRQLIAFLKARQE